MPSRRWGRGWRARRRSRRWPDDAVVLLGLSGRGDKDLAAIADRLGVARMSAAARRPVAGGRGASASATLSPGPGRMDAQPSSRTPWPATPTRRSRSAIALGLIDAGADLLEFGLPYSDPLADGATLQRASGVALAAGATLDRSLSLMERVRERPTRHAHRGHGLRQPAAGRQGRWVRSCVASGRPGSPASSSPT